MKNFIFYTFFIFVYILAIFLFNIRHTYLMWNIFLAWFPFMLSYIYRYFKIKNIYLKIINIFLALIFFPNIMYLFTDFIHLSNVRFYEKKGKLVTYFMNFNSWLILFFIFLGVYIAIKLSYITLKNYLKDIENKKIKNLIYFIISILTGIGVFVGRFIRLNSWDLFISPIKTLKIILIQIKIENIKFILLFAILQLIIIYFEEFYEKRI